jgi:hypothetical protein
MRPKAEVTADVQGTESDVLTGLQVCSFFHNLQLQKSPSKAFFEIVNMGSSNPPRFFPFWARAYFPGRLRAGGGAAGVIGIANW